VALEAPPTRLGFLLLPPSLTFLPPPRFLLPTTFLPILRIPLLPEEEEEGEEEEVEEVECE